MEVALIEIFCSYYAKAWPSPRAIFFDGRILYPPSKKKVQNPDTPGPIKTSYNLTPVAFSSIIFTVRTWKNETEIM